MTNYGPEYNAVFTLTDGTHTVTLNAASGDTYQVDPTVSSGLGMPPVRATVDDKPQTDGGIVHDAFLGARHILFSGTLLVRSAATETAVVQARNTLAASLIVVLRTILRADGTLTYTPSGGSPVSLTVRCDVAADFPGSFLKQFSFGLVAASPDWA